MLVSSEK